MTADDAVSVLDEKYGASAWDVWRCGASSAFPAGEWLVSARIRGDRKELARNSILSEALKAAAVFAVPPDPIPPRPVLFGMDQCVIRRSYSKWCVETPAGAFYNQPSKRQCVEIAEKAIERRAAEVVAWDMSYSPQRHSLNATA